MFCGKGIGVIATQTNWILQLICNAMHIRSSYGGELTDPPSLWRAEEDAAKFSGVTAGSKIRVNEGRKAVYDIYDW